MGDDLGVDATKLRHLAPSATNHRVGHIAPLGHRNAHGPQRDSAQHRALAGTVVAEQHGHVAQLPLAIGIRVHELDARILEAAQVPDVNAVDVHSHRS